MSEQAKQIDNITLGTIVQKYGDINAVIKLLEEVKSHIAKAATAMRDGKTKVSYNGVQGTFVPKVWYDADEEGLRNTVGEENFHKLFMKVSITQDALDAAEAIGILTEEQRAQLVTKKHGNRYLRIKDSRDNPVTEENVAEIVASLISLLPNKD